MSITAKSKQPQIERPDDPLGAAVPKIHLGYLDSLRALAALYVVIFHGLSDIDPNAVILQGHARWLRMVFSSGHYAVDLFIVLSGFCLMLPVVKGDGTLRGGALVFFKKRARRILPPYYLCLFVSLLLIWLFIGDKSGTLWDNSIPVTTAGLVTHLLLIQDAFRSTGGQINHSLWSISVEWRIYFIFPLLVVLWRKIGPIPSTLSAVAAGYILLVVLRHTFIFTYTNGVTPQYLGLFALGALGAGITFSEEARMQWLRQKLAWPFVTLVLSVLMIFLSSVKIHHGKVLEISILDFFVGLWSMSLLIAAGRDGSAWLHRALSWKPLAFVGTFAYSIYLIHAPILQMIWKYAQNPLHLTNGPAGFLVECLVVLPLTVAMAYLFFLACERPFLSRPVVLNTK